MTTAAVLGSKNETENDKPLVRVHKKVSTEVVKVGPKDAMSIIEKQTDNRKIYEERVENYARQMKAGEWALNGQGLTYDWFDRLLDGQHRCWAVIQSGCTIEFTVTRGVDPATFATIDTGRSRDFNDLLSIRGESNRNKLGAMVRLVWTFELFEKYWKGIDPRAYRVKVLSRRGTKLPDQVRVEQSPISDRWNTRMRPTPKELEDTLSRNPEVREWVREINNQGGILPAAALTFVAWRASKFWPRDKVLLFARRAAEGSEMTLDDPAMKVHKRFLAARLHQQRAVTGIAAVAIIMKGFNAWIKRETPKVLVWNETEPMPLIVTK
jgi:hypothetical protein